jgi:chloramphenicol-sensitive protein RarD
MILKNQINLSPTRKGILASILASCLFAFLPMYLQLQNQIPLQNLSSPGNWLAGQRILWSALFMLLILWQMGRISLFWAQLKKWRLWPRYFISALLIAPQFWIFFWAPVNGETLSVALGYFALPLVLVAVGKFIYGEQLTRIQTLACLIAASAVAYAYFIAEGLSWVVFVIALGYPLYFIWRRKYPMDSDFVFCLDNLFLLPIAIPALLYIFPLQYWGDIATLNWFYYMGLALAGTLPMLLFLYASKHLPISFFGLLSYLEPVLVFIVALLIGEQVNIIEIPIYVAIMAALVLIGIDTVKRTEISTSEDGKT